MSCENKFDLILDLIDRRIEKGKHSIKAHGVWKKLPSYFNENEVHDLFFHNIFFRYIAERIYFTRHHIKEKRKN